MDSNLDIGYVKGDFSITEIISQEIMRLPMKSYTKDEEIGFISNNLTISF